jgi:hypothetical protein
MMMEDDWRIIQAVGVVLSREGGLAPAKIEQIQPAGVNHPSGLCISFLAEV